jgi:hypothetical protein
MALKPRKRRHADDRLMQREKPDIETERGGQTE